MNLPAINCIQKSCEKQIVTEELLQLANMNGFGNEVGVVTNRVTSMFDVLAKYEKGTPEYEELMYRITVSQHYQQLAIDKIKGIVAEPMPKSWYQLKECETDFDVSVVCENKPYFMTYIYGKEKGAIKNYNKECSIKCIRTFRMELKTLLAIAEEDLTDAQKEFIFYYNKYLPILDNKCTMNRICRYMEAQLNDTVSEVSQVKFDRSVLKSVCPTSSKITEQIKELHNEYKKRISDLVQTSLTVKMDKNDTLIYRKLFIKEFETRAKEICPDEAILCNIVVDICYDTNGTKQFAWDVCRKQLIKNLENNREEM